MSDKAEKLYEVSFLSKGEGGAAVLVKHIQSIGGEIVHEGKVKEVQLAYPIKKEKSAYFGYVHCTLPGELIDDMTKALQFEDDILRFLVVIAPPKTEQRSIDGPTQYNQPKVQSQSKPTTPKQTPRDSKPTEDISNELLEEKLEEILK